MPVDKHLAEFKNLVELYDLKTVDRFPAEILSEMKESVFDFIRTVLFGESKITNDNQIESSFKTFGFSHFWVWNYSGDYIDLEKDFSVSGEPGGNDWHTINVHATINIDGRSSYTIIGDNKGDGFNDMTSCKDNFNETIKSVTDEEFKKLALENQTDCEALIKEAKAILQSYPWPLFI